MNNKIKDIPINQETPRVLEALCQEQRQRENLHFCCCCCCYTTVPQRLIAYVFWILLLYNLGVTCLDFGGKVIRDKGPLSSLLIKGLNLKNTAHLKFINKGNYPFKFGKLSYGKT